MVMPSGRVEHCFMHGEYYSTGCVKGKCPYCQREKFHSGCDHEFESIMGFFVCKKCDRLDVS